MVVNAQMIKDLRERTGAGIMECKAALKETEGDMEGAIDLLRKKGSGKAAKKAGRETGEGAVGGVVANGTGALVEIKCETDFVARNDKFQQLCSDIARHVAVAPFVADGERFLGQDIESAPGKTVKDVITEKIHELGENIVVDRRARVDKTGPGGLGIYIHGVGSIGALVELACDQDETSKKEAFENLCHDLAIQVAASNPLSLDIESLAPETVERERAIFQAQVIESGKPEKIAPRIVDGKLKKYYTEVCLLEQAFVKDPGKSVKKLLEETGKVLGDTITIKRFHRFELGNA